MKRPRVPTEEEWWWARPCVFVCLPSLSLCCVTRHVLLCGSSLWEQMLSSARWNVRFIQPWQRGVEFPGLAQGVDVGHQEGIHIGATRFGDGRCEATTSCDVDSGGSRQERTAFVWVIDRCLQWQEYLPFFSNLAYGSLGFTFLSEFQTILDVSLILLIYLCLILCNQMPLSD